MRKVKMFAAAVVVAGLLFAPLAMAQVRAVKPVRPVAPVKPAVPTTPIKPAVVAASGVTREVEFGGASSYRYLIPVNKAGNISISATWSPAAAMEAYLYSPKQKTPVANAKGTGTLKLSRAAAADESGKEWMLELKTSAGAADTTGKLTITWPGDAKSKITWQDGMPTDPKLREYLNRKLASIEKWKAGQPPSNDSERAMWALAEKNSRIASGYTKLGASLAARKDVLSKSPMVVVESSVVSRGTATLAEAASTSVMVAEHTTTYVAPESLVQRAETEGEGLGPMLRVRFLLLRCYEECTWDQGSNSDEPYILMGIVTDGGNTVTVTHSDVFGDVDSGERRPVAGVADEILWEGRIKGDSCFAMVLMERDSSRWSSVTEALEDILTDAYAEFSVGFGANPDKADAWHMVLSGGMTFWLDLLLGGYKDDRIGDVQSFIFDEQDVQDWWEIPTDYGEGKIYTTQFKGDGGNYGVMLKLGL